MLLPALLATVALSQANKPVTLSRVFVPNQHFVYDVKSHLGIESRQKGLETFMPEDYDMNYTFTLDVLKMKADGIAVVRYQRPTVTQIQGETYDSAPVTKVDKINLNYLLTISPINEVLETVEQKKLVPKKAKWTSPALSARQGDAIGQFISELYRLSLFVGSLDTALDVAPKLPFTEVKVGDTWQRTVGYQPQRLKDKSGKSEVQRLDYTFVYKGPVNVNGKPFQRVTANLNLDTDLAEWANQYIPVNEDTGESELKKLPLKLTATIDFDLDPKTFNTVSAHATSEGGFQVFLSGSPQEAVFERKLHGQTRMNLRSMTLVQAKKAQ